MPFINYNEEIKKFDILEKMTLEDIKKYAVDFYLKYFNVHDVCMITDEVINQNMDKLSSSENVGEVNNCF